MLAEQVDNCIFGQHYFLQVSSPSSVSFAVSFIHVHKTLDAGPFAPEIGSFRLHLAAEGKAARACPVDLRGWVV